MADQYTKSVHNSIRGQSGANWLLWPATTGVPAVGAVLTSGAGAWGAAADIIAAAAIAAEHWIGGFFVDTFGVAQIFEIQIGNATPATGTFYEARLDPTAITANLGFLPLPYPKWRAGGAQTSGRAGGAAAKVVGVSALYSLAL